MAEEKNNIEENEIHSWAEQKLGDVLQHKNLILLGLVLVLAAFGAILLYLQASSSRTANQFRELNIARMESFTNQSSGRLMEIADTYAGETGGNWALMMAGMYDLRSGLNTLSTNRTAGLKQIGKAEENLEKLVDLTNNKSTDLQRRSVYSLAYAKEALGKFDDAKELYQKVLDAAPECALAPFCERGVQRCSNPIMKVAYEKFKDWKDMSEEEAPGPNVEERPDISSPDMGDVDLGGLSGGSGDKPESAEETKPAETKPAETKPAETKPAETKPAETKPAETKAETKPAETKPAETKPAETKPAETKPAETKPAETKAAESKESKKAEGSEAKSDAEKADGDSKESDSNNN